MMNNISYANNTYESFDVLGKFVLIKKIQNSDLRQVNGIYIPDSEKYKNMKIGVGQIIDAGEDAVKDYGVNVNDFVLYDYYSAHGDFKDLIITNAENLIVRVTEEEAYKYLKSELN